MPPFHLPPAEEESFFLFRVLRSIARPARRCLIGCCCALALTAQAGLVYWGSEGFVENADSRNRLWTADFSMALGVFQKGFLPTCENRGQWVAMWIELDLATFDVGEARFAGVVDVSRPLPSNADSQVYFWAKNGDDLTQGPEWILLTRPEWKWPGASPPAYPALTWTTGATVSPILGEAGLNGRHLISARVGPVPVAREQWLARYFPDSPASTTPEADPDGDGLNNQTEYFLGSDPSDGSSKVCPRILADGNGVTLSLDRNPYAESTFAIESSVNLHDWSPERPELIQNRPDLIEVKVLRNPAVKSAFFRFELQPAAE